MNKRNTFPRLALPSVISTMCFLRLSSRHLASSHLIAWFAILSFERSNGISRVAVPYQCSACHGPLTPGNHQSSCLNDDWCVAFWKYNAISIPIFISFRGSIPSTRLATDEWLMLSDGIPTLYKARPCSVALYFLVLKTKNPETIGYMAFGFFRLRRRSFSAFIRLI